MDIDKYKAELESAIYEDQDGRLYIGGKVIEKVLKDAVTEALRTRDVVGQGEQCCSPTDAFYLGITCPICNKPFRMAHDK